MKKMILSMLLIAITSYAGAKTTEEVILIKQGDYCSEYVLNHYKNDCRLTFTRGIKKFDNSALINLNIPKDAWPEINANGDIIFSLNHYYDTKKIKALSQELSEKKETIRQQYLWLGIMIFGFGIMLPFAVTGMIAKFRLWNQRRKVRPYLTVLKMILGRDSR